MDVWIRRRMRIAYILILVCVTFAFVLSHVISSEVLWYEIGFGRVDGNIRSDCFVFVSCYWVSSYS